MIKPTRELILALYHMRLGFIRLGIVVLLAFPLVGVSCVMLILFFPTLGYSWKLLKWLWSRINTLWNEMDWLFEVSKGGYSRDVWKMHGEPVFKEDKGENQNS